VKAYYLVSLPLLFLLNSSQLPQKHRFDRSDLSGKITITLKHGVWKLWESKPVYQDITLDLSCQQGSCQQEVWGYAPKFNQEVDHRGTVEIIETKEAWRLKVKMNVKFHPWKPEIKQAEYNIELIPQKNQLIGAYLGTFNDRSLQGKVVGTINSPWPKQIANYQPIKPEEHPRLIFRASQLPALQQKAKTPTGQAILAQLKKTFSQPIYYVLPQGYGPNGGYHAVGYCFLSVLNEDPQATATAWTIVEKSLSNPGPRLLEQSSIVAGVAIAYDLCYQNWDKEKRKKITSWLAMQSVNLINGSSRLKGWNPSAWSNWNARTRSAAGLATLAILHEPDSYFPSNKFFSKPSDSWFLFKSAQRHIQRYLLSALGDRGFGTEGDLYTNESLTAILPFIAANKNVLGEDLVAGSKAEWFLPHYAMRSSSTENGRLSLSTYGRHRLGPSGSLFALGLGLVPPKFLPGIFWFFDRNFGWQGDKTFGVNSPHEAAFALVGYPESVKAENPEKIFGRVLVDKEKGFYLFRNRWQDKNDFVSSIYLNRKPLGQSWSFPEAGSFRIWGLGTQWAKAGPDDGQRDSENVVVNSKSSIRSSQPVFFEAWPDGLGVVSTIDRTWLRSFAVDYSGVSGAPGLFVIADRFTGNSDARTWVMYSSGKVKIEGQSFTLQGDSGATMRGTFIVPDRVKLSAQSENNGVKIMAVGADEFFVVMTVQKGRVPQVKISGSGLDANVRVGDRAIFFVADRIVLTKD
jgi:hypothetical protein